MCDLTNPAWRRHHAVMSDYVPPWVKQMFSAQAVEHGGVIRRSRADVEKHASLDWVIKVAKERGFHVIETGDQVVVLCNEGGIVIHC